MTRLSAAAAHQVIAALDLMANDFEHRAASMPETTFHADWLLGAEMLARRLGLDIDDSRSQRVTAAQQRQRAQPAQEVSSHPSMLAA